MRCILIYVLQNQRQGQIYYNYWIVLYVFVSWLNPIKEDLFHSVYNSDITLITG
jgi:hypothetical protein